ncbi:hypothetical protein JAAARDRAFT_112664, partial [Jaapia argillacea MUCL 33604]
MSYPHHLNLGHPPYGPPLLRPSSPADTIGTVYGPDETSQSDDELSQEAFDNKCEEGLKLREMRETEVLANRCPLLPKPKAGTEEKDMFISVMANLRNEVRKLEENELFEETMLRGSQVGLEPQPSSNNIDSIMRSMMGYPTPKSNNTVVNSNQHGAGATDFGNPAWNPGFRPLYPTNEASGGSTPGKRTSKGKGKS